VGGEPGRVPAPDSEPARAPDPAAEVAAEAAAVVEAIEAAEVEIAVEAVAEAVAEAEAITAAEAPGGETAGPDDAAHPAASKRESKRWELVIAIAVAVAAMTGALLTYLSIQKESAAADNDSQSVAQTILVQSQRSTATTNTYAAAATVTRARQLLAEGKVLATSDPAQASLLFQDAASLDPALGAAVGYVTGSGVTARFNYEAALQGYLAVDTSVSIPPNEPDVTAQLAERERVKAVRIALSVVGLLLVVVLLTVARLTGKIRLKRGVFAVAVLGYAAALSFGLIAQFS